MRTIMYLVRHGATPANLAKPARLQGRSDVALADLGVQQAAATGRHLAHVPLVASYTSPLVRARATAALIAPHLESVNVPAFTECDVGRWEGVPWDEIQRDDAEAFASYMADPATHGYPDGENFTDVLARAQPAFDELFQRHIGATFVVVSHHVVNRAFLAVTLGLPLSLARRVALDNCGISVVVQDVERRRVKVLNSTLHLGELHIDE